MASRASASGSLAAVTFPLCFGSEGFTAKPHTFEYTLFVITVQSQRLKSVKAVLY